MRHYIYISNRMSIYNGKMLILLTNYNTDFIG